MDSEGDPVLAPDAEPAAAGRRRRWLTAVAVLGEGGLAALGWVWASRSGFPLIVGSWPTGIAAGVATAIGLAAVQYWLLRAAPDFAFVQSLRRLYREVLRPLFADVGALDILVVSLMAGVGEELLFRGAAQQAWGLVAASLLFGLCHVGGRATWALGVWAAAVGFLLGWLAVATGGLLAPIVAHAVYDALALSYIRWSRAPD